MVAITVLARDRSWLPWFYCFRQHAGSFTARYICCHGSCGGHLRGFHPGFVHLLVWFEVLLIGSFSRYSLWVGVSAGCPVPLTYRSDMLATLCFVWRRAGLRSHRHLEPGELACVFARGGERRGWLGRDPVLSRFSIKAALFSAVLAGCLQLSVGLRRCRSVFAACLPGRGFCTVRLVYIALADLG